MRLKMILLFQRHVVALAVGQLGSHAARRIARVGQEHDIPRIDQGRDQMGDSLLGADQGEHFRPGVKLHLKLSPVKVGYRLPKLGTPHKTGVFHIVRTPNLLDQLLHNMLRGRQVGIANPEIDDIHSCRFHRFFFPVDFREHVGWYFRNPIGAVSHGPIHLLSLDTSVGKQAGLL